VTNKGGDNLSDIKWIKVAVDMFEDNKIEFLRSLPDGDALIVIWIQMLSIAGQSNMGGYLMVTEGIPYTEQLLSNKLRRQPVLLQFALETLTKLKMINIEDGPFHITKWEKHQNVDGMEKVRLLTNERVKKHRTKEKEKLETLQCNATETLQVTHGNATELELDLEKKQEEEEREEEKEIIQTAMDAYYFSFKKWNYTGQIQGYVVELSKRGYTDAFVREVFLAMGEYGASPDVNYMRKLSEDWISKGIYTLSEAKARREKSKEPTVIPFKQQEKVVREVEPYFRPSS
jgi:predicted phage replisome organizer